jgi:Xaa-Pro aminopeptidase
VENIAFKIYEYVRRELPSATFLDVTQDIVNLRMVKSEEEIGTVRECARLNLQLFDEVKRVAKPGVNERDVYAHINNFVSKAGVEHMFHLIASGPYPVSARIWPVNRVLSPQDSVFLELSPRLDGYYTQICVTHPVAEPPDKMKKLLDTAAAALQDGSAAMKPGNCTGDAARAMQGTIEKAGYIMPFRPGHSMGHELDEPPGVVADGTTVFKPGMTIVLHPSVMDENGDGVFAGDSYLITEAGWERLTTTI